jgi:hypothetical protein
VTGREDGLLLAGVSGLFQGSDLTIYQEVYIIELKPLNCSWLLAVNVIFGAEVIVELNC